MGHPKQNYQKETEAEMRDRCVGRSIPERMSADRKADVVNDKLNSRKLLVYVYIGLLSSGWVSLIIAFCTNGWWVCFETNRAQSADGDIMAEHGSWGMSIRGISVLLEFCGSDGTCFTTVDRHLYYDRDLNAEFQWSDETGNWTAAAADVHRGSARLLICVIAYFGCSIYVSGVTGLAFCHQDTRCRMFSALLMNFLALCCLCLGTAAFVSSVLDFILLLETNNFISSDSKPQMTPGYDAYLMVATILCTLGSVVVNCLLIRPKSECPAFLEAQATVEEQARSKRRNTYFNDADSTSHIYEHNPCDSFRGTCSKQRGWTADVHTQVSNVLQGIEGSAAAVKIVHPPRKDPIPTGIQREKLADAILNNLVSTPVPQGFKTRLCLLPNSTLPPLVIDDKPTARAFRSSSPRSRDRNRESAAIMGKRTRQVTRAPAPEKWVPLGRPNPSAEEVNIVISHQVASAASMSMQPSAPHRSKKNFAQSAPY